MATEKLKPSDMGVTGTKRTITAHEKIVRDKIKTFKNKLVKFVCETILESASGTKIPVEGLTSEDYTQIKNYFAEVAAPILVAKFNMLSGVTKGSTKVFYSTSDTERLYDFKLYVGSKEELISNKQMKGGTNTLKPGDVIVLVDKDADLKNKWSKTKYYSVFKILDESNVVSGPIKAIAKNYPKKTNLSQSDYTSVISKLTKNDVLISPKDVPKPLMDMVKADPFVLKNYKDNGGLSGTAINFMFEKLLVEESKKDDKYNELFVDVTTGNVLFFKFDLSNRGVLSYDLIDPKKPSEKTKKASLRSKQGVERRSSSGRLKLDKLGFQP